MRGGLLFGTGRVVKSPTFTEIARLCGFGRSSAMLTWSGALPLSVSEIDTLGRIRVGSGGGAAGLAPAGPAARVRLPAAIAAMAANRLRAKVMSDSLSDGDDLSPPIVRGGRRRGHAPQGYVTVPARTCRYVQPVRANRCPNALDPAAATGLRSPGP